MATIHYLNAARDINEVEVYEPNDFYSVEIKIDDAAYTYQFKLWKSPSEPTFVLVKEGSGILRWIHPGDVLSTTYYSSNLARPNQQLSTQVLSIHKDPEGRFRGHYIVELGIVEN